VKPYQELTRRGRLRRLGQLARAALEAYGLAGARLKLLQASGNVTFRVDAAGSPPVQVDRDLYVEHRYALRMHEPGYQSDAAIASELAWLAALRRDADLPVPEPVPALSGELLVEVGIPGVPEPRRCSLLRWVRGRMLTPQHVSPQHLRAVGRLMARMHRHAAHWQPPAGFSRPRYDWEGLYGDNPLVKVPASVVWPLLPRAHIEPFTMVTGQLRQVMEDLGQGPDAFGLIQADLAVGANVLFQGGQARAIDFDDCAFGYWMFDLGVALSEWWGSEAFPWVREALLEGYVEFRSLPDEQLQHLELFIAAWHAFEMYWATAGGYRFPSARQAYAKWAERAAQDLRKYFDRDRCIER
jgi:Ser/Thr protein kinase RdoA (MazF antagonist)